MEHNNVPLAASARNIDTASDAPALSIIVVSYNTLEMTLACLASVLAQTQATACEIIVVDNASSDGSAEAIAALGPGIRLLPLQDNIGFARANNLAAHHARGSHVLLLNPDTLVLDAAIDKLMAFANANPSAGIWGGRTLFGDRRLDPTSVWARMTPWSLLCRALNLDALWPASPVFNAEGIGGWNRNSIRRVDIVCGCFLMIRRALWEQLGGFDRAFFMYGEEADLCLRAAALGARPLFTPDATIIHYGGASETTQAGKMIKLFRAKVTLMRRHWRGPAIVAGRYLLLLWALMRLAGSAASSGRAKKAALWREVWRQRRVWLAGYEDGASPPAAQPAAPSAELTGAIEVSAMRPANPVRYSICTLMTSRSQYADMLASFRAGGFVAPETEYLYIDNSAGNGFTAYDGLNRLLEAARGDRIILCHQDLLLMADGRTELDARLTELEAHDPNWAVAGNAGGTGLGQLALCLSDPHGENQRTGLLPARAHSLDENFIVLARSARLGFSRDLKGFHFYGADLCLAADLMGYTSYVIGFHLRHLSQGQMSPAFYEARDAFRAKWSRALRPRWIQTTCGLVWLSGNRVGQIFGAAIQAPALRAARWLPAARGWTGKRRWADAPANEQAS